METIKTGRHFEITLNEESAYHVHRIGSDNIGILCATIVGACKTWRTHEDKAIRAAKGGK